MGYEKWDGQERRRVRDGRRSEDHDLLIKIDSNLANFLRNFIDHINEDKSQFERVTSGLEEMKKYVWMGLGGVAVLEFAIHLLFKR